MGDESRTDRIVASPARKAIGYGVRAVHVVAAAKGAKISRKDALLKKFRSARPWYVLRARKLWLGVAGNDPLLSQVWIGDLKTFSSVGYALTRQAGVRDLWKSGFNAWTNSSRLVLVNGQPVPPKDQRGLDDRLRITLLHEAVHVGQFEDTRDQPPKTYREMVGYEAKAYAETKKALDQLEPQGTDLAKTNQAEILDFFTGLDKPPGNGKLPDSYFVDELTARGLLPNSANPKDPASLYVRSVRMEPP